MRNSLWMVPLALLNLTSCGYIGDPLPPSLETPVAVTNLRVSQFGSKLMIRFNTPPKTTEGLILKKIADTELRLGQPPAGVFNMDTWAASATRVEVPSTKDGSVELEVAVDQWIGKDIVVGVRTQGTKQRFSAWSNLVVLPVIVGLIAPQKVSAMTQVDGVMLRWQQVEGAEYRVYRGGSELAKVAAGEFLDSTVEFGKPASFKVQAFRKFNDKQMAEGPASEAVEITPTDTFPPAVPESLRLIAGVASIEISWQRNLEPDWKAYKIWRSEGDGAFKVMLESVTQPTYSDRTAARGKRYRYAVSAVDNLGNESEKSKSEELTLPE